MTHQFSLFGERFTNGPGILSLMNDLGQALAGNDGQIMLGGGNPSHILPVQQRFRARLQRVLDEPGAFEKLIGNYESPGGNERFIAALVKTFNAQYQWKLQPDNVALTPGSQSSFFFLFNLFGGSYANGAFKRIVLPLTPEYIGYADLGVENDMFQAFKPTLEILDNNLFKYRVDLSALQELQGVGAICLSRPTNPTGNVVTDSELQALLAVARKHRAPLIIDSAYGAPFPNLLFESVAPLQWNDDIVLCMSLSKVGLPGARTGIVIARKDIVAALTSLNAIVNLAGGNLGPALAYEMIASGELIDLCTTTIRPYYQERGSQALQWFREMLIDVPYHIHRPEGAMFLWLWFPELPIDSQTLYERLKRRKVLVVPGHHFFPGLRDNWRHKQECIRVTYAQPPEIVKRGIEIIAEEVRHAFAAPPGLQVY